MKTQTSRDLFNKFLLETSEEEFNKIIAELQVDNDISPKWSEYLNEFDHMFNSFWGEDAINPKMQKAHLEKIGLGYKIPPSSNKNYTKKDLSYQDGSFFLLYLQHDRRKKSCFFI
jgi:hypothetical protein